MTAGGPGRDIVDGRFELLERLGGGGMGLVWRARDVVLQREVALKEVRSAHADALGDEDPVAAHVQRERVLREARALARLHHPNVVTIYHIVDSPQQRCPWLVMELIRGGSLEDRLGRGPLPPGEVARIGRGVLAALRAAHEAGIQHRDVKPANVLLRPDGTPVLTDFGIAALRESAALTTTGTLIGSPEYLAPERIRGVEGDPASDLWSLGMLMYVAAEGHNPLRRDTTLATIAAVLDAPLPEPRGGGPLAAVLSALLVRDPAARPDAVRLDQLLGAAERAALVTAHLAPFQPGRPGPGLPVQPAESAVRRSGPPSPDSPAHGPVPSYQGAVNGGPASAVADHRPPWPVDVAPTGPRSRRNGAFVAALTAVTVLGLSGALVWSFHGAPAAAATGNGRGAGSSVTATAPGRVPVTGATSNAAVARGSAAGGQGAGLLAPAAARSLVRLLDQKSAGGRVIELVLYPGYADAEILTAGDPTLYDDYYYRGGVIQRSGGGTVTDQVPLDLAAVNWNALPTLLAEARKRLGIAHPTSEYLVIQGGWIGQSPGIGVYLGDDYGSAYLLADFKGQVVRAYPR
ncbi:protein kinase [Actinocrinis puniceicyclus]|uniref:non-specific serine/threonine protein kinase n=1 Tax=Actinocrinis puniceicyclus TaxID=977794 RepID=A0A8J7WNX6_9ACTN|nr:serine/threonine-protein kinase [Actinocrinis puniceicyclus]MBS2962884.1 protein kinase [Actinocrinis puniceicyclus]